MKAKGAWIAAGVVVAAVCAAAIAVYVPKYGPPYRARRWLRGQHGATVVKTQDLATSMAVRGDDLFFVDVGTLARVPVSGGVREVVAGGASGDVVVTAHYIAWGDAPPFFVKNRSSGEIARVGEAIARSDFCATYTTMTIHGDRLYYTAPNDLVVFGLSSGGSLRLAEVRCAHRVAVDDTFAYVTLMGDAGGLVRVHTLSGDKETLADGPLWPSNIALDDDSVYFVAELPAFRREIRKVKKTGGGVTTLAEGGTPWHLAIVGKSLYWLDLNLDKPRVRVVETDGSHPRREVRTPIEYPQNLAAGGKDLFVADWYEIARVTP